MAELTAFTIAMAAWMRAFAWVIRELTGLRKARQANEAQSGRPETHRPGKTQRSDVSEPDLSSKERK